MAWPVEGVLNPTAKRASARVSGEAPVALPLEGVLNPTAKTSVSEGERGGSSWLCHWRGC